MKTVLTTLMMLPAISAGGAQHTPPPLPPQAIYILHIGESDKPLWPFVLAVKKPQAADLANMFQEPFWRHANHAKRLCGSAVRRSDIASIREFSGDPRNGSEPQTYSDDS
jgi:hypothetical protein